MTGSWPEAEIDHINRNRADNRFANLRPATSTEQKWNASLSKRNRSGVKGVCWATQAGKWQAAIRASGSRRLLGMFDRFEDAKAAREQAEIKLFGSFSALAEIGPSAP